MAEIAIPLALLSGMYVLSNQEDGDEKPSQIVKPRQEGFKNNTTLNKVKNTDLPNNKPIEKNYPISGTSVLKNNPHYYASPNAATDRYYQQVEYEKKAANDPNTYMSLTGNQVSASDLNHNNMVPFFGSKVKQNTYLKNDSILDNKMGSGTYHKKKEEIAPLFRPEENMNWAHGTPNQNDFIQSRMNPSTNMANVKPFQEIRVGPGLNKKDGVLGTGGFNSGMEARERWMAKTVDELRAKNNPKVTYAGVTLGGKRHVTNRGNMGKMEHHRPDTYYVNTPERYFTTTGLEKAQTARAIQIMPEENRQTTTQSYYGAGADAQGNAAYVKGQYMDPKRNVLDSFDNHITNAHAPNRQIASEGEHGLEGFKNSVLPNNRSLTTERQPEYGIVSSFAKAVIAPLLDVLRPSRKENVVGNARPVGNAGAKDNQAGYVYNPANRARTTIREMTENESGHRFVNNQGEVGGYGYIVNKQQSVAQERDTTNCEYQGGLNNQNEVGGYGYIVNKQRKVDQQRDSTNVFYMGNQNNQQESGGYGYTVNEQQPVAQARDTTSTYYVGNSGNTQNSNNVMTYDAAYNANLIDKEPISRGRVPMGDNVKVFNGQDMTNIKVDKLESDRENNRMFVPQQMAYSSPSLQHKGQMTARSEYGQGVNCERNSGDLLSAFNNNPYTHSLQSVA
jgi:hypothetical protein